jgi:hypothetical protein
MRVRSRGASTEASASTADSTSSSVSGIPPPAPAPVLDVHGREAAAGEVDRQRADVGAVVAGAPEAAVEEQRDRVRPAPLRQAEVEDLLGTGAVARSLRGRAGLGGQRAELGEEALEVERHRANDRRWQ